MGVLVGGVSAIPSGHECLLADARVQLDQLVGAEIAEFGAHAGGIHLFHCRDHH